MMKKIILAMCFLFLISGATAFSNYSFETGDLTGWDTNTLTFCSGGTWLIAPITNGRYDVYDGKYSTYGGTCISPQKTYAKGERVCFWLANKTVTSYTAVIIDEKEREISGTLNTPVFANGYVSWNYLCGRTVESGRIALKVSGTTLVDKFEDSDSGFVLKETYDVNSLVPLDQDFKIRLKYTNTEYALYGSYNYPSNNSFETGDYTNWTHAGTGTTFSISTDWASEGNKSAKLTMCCNSSTAGYVLHDSFELERGDKLCVDYSVSGGSPYCGIGCKSLSGGTVCSDIQQISGVGTECWENKGGTRKVYFYCRDTSNDYKNYYFDNFKVQQAVFSDRDVDSWDVVDPILRWNCDINGNNCTLNETMIIADGNYWEHQLQHSIEDTYNYWVEQSWVYSAENKNLTYPIKFYDYSALGEIEVSGQVGTSLYPQHIETDMELPITIKAKYTLSGTEITTADCEVQISGESLQDMTYNSGTGYYEYTRSAYGSEIFKTYDVNCVYGTTSDGAEGDIHTIESLASQLTIENISNTNYTLNLYNVDLSPATASGDLIFSIQNDSTNSFTNTEFTITNSLEDGRQYYIYTATPTQYGAGTWVFDSSLTYGTDYDDPIQKIWDSTNSQYEHTYEVPIITTGSKTYYNIVYRTPMRNWTSLEGTSKWLLLNEPTNNVYDIYTASPATDIWAKFLTPIPNLTSDETHSYEFQFTAYADTNGATLKVGYRDEETGNETFISLQLTTAKKRYSVPIQDDWLIFKTENLSTVYTIYMKDYSLSQRGFFKTKLEERTLGNSTLPVANYSGTTVNNMDGNFDPLIIHQDQNYGQTITMPTVDGDWEAITIRIGKLADCNQEIPLLLSVYETPAKTNKVGDVSIYCSNIPESGLVNWFDAKIYWTTPVDYDGKDTYYFEYTTDANVYANEAYYLYEPEGTDPYAGGQKYSNGSPDTDDDLMFMLHTSGAYEYVVEGEDFRIHTYAYDRDNLITILKIDTYLDAYADSNKLKHWEYEVSTGTENTFLINNILDSLIDLRGTDNPAKILITATLCGDDKCYEQISDWIYMRQFPSMPMDIFIKLRNYENRKGNYPRGKTVLTSTNTESIKGVEITIFETSLLTNHTAEEILEDNTLYKARKTFYKDEYFSCYADECTFDWSITDWVYEKATTTEDNYTIWANVITNTSYPDYENILLNKSMRTTTIVDKWVLFRTVEAYHRGGAGDFTPEYRNWEEIRLLGQLRNPEGDYLGDDVDTWIEIRDCGTTADCTDTDTTNGEIAFENIKFRPTDYRFYPDTKVNTWFFEGLLTEDNGGLLEDGHHYRVKFVVEDKSGKYYDYNSTHLAWAEKPFTFNMGWTLENLGYYFTDEVFITINNAYTPTTPQLQCGGCVRIQNQDVDGMESLEQTILCGVLYDSSETVPENFLITLANQNSNFNEDDEGLQQFIKTKINWKDIAHSDGTYTTQQITANIDETIEDSGDLLLYGLKYIGGDAVVNWIGMGATDLTNIIAFHIDPTSGLTTDCNLNIPVDDVPHVFFYEIKGINIVNKYSYDSEGNINPRNFYKWASENDISLPDNKTTMTVWVNGEIVETKTLPSRFVVHAKPTQEKIQEAEDANTTGETEYLGQWLTFDMSIGMLYNNQQDNQEIVLPLKYLVKFEEGASQDSADLQKNIWDWLTGTNDIDGDGHPDDGFFDDPVGKIVEIPFIITGWMLGNAVWFAVIVLIVLVLAFVVRAVRSGGSGGGGQTVINVQGNERG